MKLMLYPPDIGREAIQEVECPVVPAVGSRMVCPVSYSGRVVRLVVYDWSGVGGTKDPEIRVYLEELR
jgi:hypothetical protein